MEPITLKLTLDEVNTVLAALAQQPYLKVAELVYKVRTQGNDQATKAPSDEGLAETAQTEVVSEG